MSRRREPRAGHLALQNYVIELETHVRGVAASLQVGQARWETAKKALELYEQATARPAVKKKRKVLAPRLIDGLLEVADESH
jgi:hypothetical protein